MKVILVSLLLLSASFINACKTCYYYEQLGIDQPEECECCQRPAVSPCNPSEECCTNGSTYEHDEDYFSPPGNY